MQDHHLIFLRYQKGIIRRQIWRGIENQQKNKTQTTLIGLYGFQKENISNPTHPSITTANTTLIKVNAPNENHTINSTIPIDVDTANDQPRIKLLARTLCCKTRRLRWSRICTWFSSMDALIPINITKLNQVIIIYMLSCTVNNVPERELLASTATLVLYVPTVICCWIREYQYWRKLSAEESWTLYW